MTEPTQFGDNVAAEMRAYFEAHKREKWVEGTADTLMLGLFNIAIRAIEATCSSVVIEALTEAKREIEIGLEYVIEAANEDGCKYGKEAKVFKQHMRGIERMEMLLAKIDKALSTPRTAMDDALRDDARLLIEESLYHLRIDERAENYHKRALAFLDASRLCSPSPDGEQHA